MVQTAIHPIEINWSCCKQPTAPKSIEGGATASKPWCKQSIQPKPTEEWTKNVYFVMMLVTSFSDQLQGGDLWVQWVTDLSAVLEVKEFDSHWGL